MPYALNDDVELWYETFGFPADPALLLVNGLGSQSINYVDALCEAFVAAGFHVVRFDNRDVGWSTAFDHVTPDLGAVVAARAAGEVPVVPYTLGDMAADAVAVLDAAGIDRAHVLGCSMGGMIVQTLAIEHPDRLLSVTSVMSTTGDPDVGRPAPEAQELLLAPPPTDREAYIQRQFESVRTWGTPAGYDEDRLREVHGAAYDRCFAPAGQARQLMAIMAAPSRTEALGGVDLPFLVIHGDQDRLVDPSGGVRTAEAVPGARFELVEGMGHDYPPLIWPTLVGLVGELAASAR